MKPGQSNFYSLPLLSFKSLLGLGEKAILPLIDGKEAWFLFGLPNSGRASTVRQLVYFPEVVSPDWQKKIQKRNWVIVDLAAEKNPQDYLLASPYLKKQAKKIKASSQTDFSETVASLKKPITFIVNSLDILENEKRRFLLRRLMESYYAFPTKVSFLFCQGWEEIKGLQDHLGALHAYLVANRSWFSLQSQADMDQFLGRGRQKFTKEEADQFYSFSGGYLPLMKRFCDQTELLKNVGSALLDPVVDYALNTLWESCTPQSQQQLTMLLTQEKKRAKEDFADYLIKTGLVRVEGGEGRFFSPLLASWLKKVLGQKDFGLSLMRGKLYLNGEVNLETILTDQEYQITKMLYHQRGKVASRDQVAAVMWPKNPDQNYSDWAIDQVIYQIRKKLGDFGKDRQLKTLKGKGFLLNV
ncbi:winged helix-turn-helix domain-containing protein [Patescibacteria group bacterium]